MLSLRAKSSTTWRVSVEEGSSPSTWPLARPVGFVFGVFRGPACGGGAVCRQTGHAHQAFTARPADLRRVSLPAQEALYTRLKREVPPSRRVQRCRADNYILMYKIPEAEGAGPHPEQGRSLAGPYPKSRWISAPAAASASLKARMMTAAMRPMYERARTTKHFYADDQCVGCGLCAKRCTAHVIVMEDGRPTWTKDKCNLCMACARCGAIR